MLNLTVNEIKLMAGNYKKLVEQNRNLQKENRELKTERSNLIMKLIQLEQKSGGIGHD